ncbi:MAG: flavodoxin family protein [Bacillota bacterium]|nr:flavodoxin family protein [Bacillota bacterium]
MSESVIIINGSLRINGNTDRLIKHILKGAENSASTQEVINLRELKIGNCAGCYNCRKNHVCPIHDDMDKIRRKIEKADLLLFASPLYWCSVTGLMKTFIDRLFFYYHEDNKALIRGKKVITLTVFNQKDAKKETDLLNEFYKRLFHAIGLRYVNSYDFSGLMDKDGFINNDDYLATSLKIGTEFDKL